MSEIEITAAKVWRAATDAASESGIAFRPSANKRGIAVVVAALAQARAEVLEEAKAGLFEAIAHGDEEHRAWLKGMVHGWFAHALNTQEDVR